MPPSVFLTTFLDPNLRWLRSVLGSRPPTNDDVRLWLLAVAGQESNWQNVAQGGGGPGRGPWQFEPPTCNALVINASSRTMMRQVALSLGIPTGELDGAAFYSRILTEPKIAVTLARLDLWCDPHAVPSSGDEDGAWKTYVNVWRPGAVTAGGDRAVKARHRWTTNYAAATAALKPSV